MSIKFYNSITGTTCVISPTVCTNSLISTGGVILSNGSDLSLVAPAGSCDVGDIVFYSGGTTSCEWARLWATTNGCLLYRNACGGLVNWSVYHSGNINQASVNNSDYFDGRCSNRFIYGDVGTVAGSRRAPTGYTSSDRAMWKSGFWDVNGADWTPTEEWYWGITAAHVTNTPTYNYGMQLIAQGTGDGTGCNYYIRSIHNNTVCSWRRIYIDGDAVPSWNGFTTDCAILYRGEYYTPNYTGGTTYNSLINNGTYLINGGSDSRALLAYTVGGSVGTVQMEFSWDCSFRWRNRTDSANWTEFRRVAHLDAPTFTTCIETPVIKITTGAAAGCVLTSTADGTAVWSTPTGGGGALSGLTDVTITTPAAGDVLTYSNSSKWCNTAPVDITTNLSTGDLLSYNGTTITGSSLVQTSPTVMTFKGNCLDICGDANTTIKICNMASTSTVPSLCISGAYNTCCYGGNVQIWGGWNCRITGSDIVRGGTLFLNGGYGFQCSNTNKQAYGGPVCIIGGTSCNSYGGGYSLGGDVHIRGGNSCATTPTTNAYGGNIYICGGCAPTTTNYGYIQLSTPRCIQMNCYLVMCGFYCNTPVAICIAFGCGKAIAWAQTSDCRCKRNIQPISNALSIVNQLNGVCYQHCNFYSGVTEDTKYNVGLVAQDVLPILPEIVGCSPANEEDIQRGITGDTYSINYNSLTAVLVQAIKEQQAQICCLQNEINILKGS